jgi:hypothetical protein
MSENLYAKGNKTTTKQFRDNFDAIAWCKDNEKPCCGDKDNCCKPNKDKK